ncbi:MULTISPECIES: hypothetical protein, partial [Acinetobacter calcoaceticus/baumannii complex]|uniref:hypothetical protein n=1 Tax=Acinetobacter calcoaceticus/baumannii complex TaxID=909768 RepID=UPI0019D27BAE
RNPAGLLCKSRLGAKGSSCGSAVSSTKSQILSASLEPCNGNQGGKNFYISSVRKVDTLLY